MGKKANILLGVTGSIAAYKSSFLIRLLIKEGHEVKVIMTKDACSFISALSLSTLSKNKVHTDFYEDDTWSDHVGLGLWADVFLIAPATANTLAKMSHGICDNMLLASYLSAKCPVVFAPAMDRDMWLHPATKNNIDQLKNYGNHIIEPAHGELASGLIGTGRMAEPETIVSFLNQFLEKKTPLKNKKVLITAGPTFERIDPVRFIGNHSTGKMGIALANLCDALGAEVTLVLGPSSLRPNGTVKVTAVTTADEMYQACDKQFDKADIAIMAAAVADFTPSSPSDKKIKKANKLPKIDLKKTIDIAATLGKRKKDNQLFIGFALETNNANVNAKSKLTKKNFDFIVLNSLSDKGAGFGHDTNKITIYKRNGEEKPFELKSKKEVAQDIVNEIIIELKK